MASAAIDAEHPPARLEIRWDPSAGGPRSPQETLALLGLLYQSTETFQVRYVATQSRPMSEVGLQVIVRERSSPQGIETEYEVRGPESVRSLTTFTSWLCPLRGYKSTTTEIGLTWASEDTPTTMYARSCSASGRLGELLPAQSVRETLGCLASVQRSRSGSLRSTIGHSRTVDRLLK